jgi:hypothetical protein
MNYEIFEIFTDILRAHGNAGDTTNEMRPSDHHLKHSFVWSTSKLRTTCIEHNNSCFKDTGKLQFKAGRPTTHFDIVDSRPCRALQHLRTRMV